MLEKYYNQSILKAINILEAVGQENGSVGLSELSRIIGLDKSTIYRMALSLESKGWLIRDSDSGKYSLGLKFLMIADMAGTQNSIRVIRPELLRLAECVQETVVLSFWDGKGVICADKVEASHKLQISSYVGQYFPIYAGATGFAVLLGMPEDMALYILSNVELEPFTPKTITSKELLFARYREMKAQGYVLSTGQVDPGVTGIAMPVYFPYEKSYASLGVSLPETRATQDIVAHIVSELTSSLKIIMERLEFSVQSKKVKT